MIKTIRFWHAARVAAILAILLSVFGTSPALAARDRTPPTKPTNLRVTALTSYKLSLAWNPSTDNSGTFSYKVVVSDGAIYTLPQTQTTFNYFVARSVPIRSMSTPSMAQATNRREATQSARRRPLIPQPPPHRSFRWPA